MHDSEPDDLVVVQIASSNPKPHFLETSTMNQLFNRVALGQKIALGFALVLMTAASSQAGLVTFAAFGQDAAAITPTRDAFRAAVGGGTVAGANGSFGGLRREINWDGVPANLSDPNPLPAD